MKQRIKNILLSGLIGISVTTFGIMVAYISGGSSIGRLLYWQGYLLQSFVPAPNLGPPTDPHFEATPIHMFAFFLGIPLGILIYSILSYAVISMAQRKMN